MSELTVTERGSVALRALGLLLILVPFVPIRALFGTVPDASKLVTPGQWLLGTGIFLVTAWLVCLIPASGGLGRRARTWAGRVAPWTRAVTLVILAVLLPCVSWFVFRHRPLLVDSVAQLFQAHIYASGRWTAPAPTHPAFFSTQNMLFDGARWYSEYPPGHPALLALGLVARAPWLVPVLLSLGSAMALYGFVRRVYDATTARVTAVLLVLCPFYWFMGASFMNHVSMLFSAASFLWLFAMWEDSGRVWPVALAGVALGLGVLVRPLTALAIAGAFGAFGLISAARRHRPAHLAVGATAFLALALLYPAYNAATTGNPWLPGYLKLWGSSHGLGFHATPWGQVHTPLLGLRNELTDLQLLNLNLFEWPLPALWPIGAGLLLGWLERRWDRRLVLAFLAIPIAYFFYWHRDSYLGPRFLYASLAFVLPLTARVLVVAVRRLEGRHLGLGGAFRPVDVRRWAFAAVSLCFAWSVFVGIPGRWRVYASGMASMKRDVVAGARAAGIDRALVFVKVNAGNRLLSRLRGMGAEAGIVETAYRSVDFCELVEISATASSRGWSRRRLVRGLRELAARREDVVRVPGLNGDPTLRLRRDRLEPRLRLPPRCRRELRYDQDGYDVYTPHLLANRPDLSGPLVVARDLRDQDAELERQFPDRPAYLYHDGIFSRLDPRDVPERPPAPPRR
ncbi:MAG TPA: glycosyltransferase family 39 protein [Gemmatimonadota bacterium]|nr:glycosyltransferase family 39 protein [Gemmatimonadota bacterium]